MWLQTNTWPYRRGVHCGLKFNDSFYKSYDAAYFNMCCHHMGMQCVAIKSNESLQPAQDFMDPAQGEDKSAEKPQGALHTTVCYVHLYY